MSQKTQHFHFKDQMASAVQTPDYLLF